MFGEDGGCIALYDADLYDVNFSDYNDMKTHYMCGKYLGSSVSKSFVACISLSLLNSLCLRCSCFVHAHRVWFQVTRLSLIIIFVVCPVFSSCNIEANVVGTRAYSVVIYTSPSRMRPSTPFLPSSSLSLAAFPLFPTQPPTNRKLTHAPTILSSDRDQHMVPHPAP